jgi:hypothetical protein
MSVLVFHLLAGLLTGAIFGVQTLLLVVFFVLIEAVCGLIGGSSIGFGQWLGAGIVLQFGYLGGIFLRSALERFSAGAKLHTSSRIRN